MILDGYDWPGGREAMLRFGGEAGPVVVAVLPLFEEANRTRTFTVHVLRLLAERGIAGALPDLPGTGESVVPTHQLREFALREALEAAIDHLRPRRCYVLGVRSGSLLDGFALAHGRYHLSPVTGAEVLRTLHRTRQAEAGIPLAERWYMEERWQEEDGLVRIAGNLIAADALLGLSLLDPYDQPGVPRRVARLATDPGPAEIHLPGTPLWRAKEPGDDPALAAALANDIARWIAACES